MPRAQLPKRQDGDRCTIDNNLWYHVAFRHLQDTIRFGGGCPPKCKRCGLQTRIVGATEHLE